MQKRLTNRVSDTSQLTASREKSAKEWSEPFVMDRCGLPCVPSLKGRENVEMISLQHNLIVRIDTLSLFRNLKVLNLYDNKIERISGLDTLISLRVLMLGKNRIKGTDGLEALLNLDILDLHGNQINALTNLNGLSSLRVLNLAANSLKKLSSLEGLFSLEELNLKRNRISKIAAEISHAKKLERLYLSNNDLRRLEDLEPMPLLSGLKELTLDGNPLTFNPNYVMHTVGSLPSLILLDQNSISASLRREAEAWFLRHLQPDTLTHTKPFVKVQHKNPPGSASIVKKKVAVVRPMAVQSSEASPVPETSTQDIRPAPVHPILTKKSFRQIAFSAMVCNSQRSRREEPVFKFRLRPPTADWNSKLQISRRRSRTSAAAAAAAAPVSDVEDSSESWTSDADDSDCSSDSRRRRTGKSNQKLSANVDVKEQLRDLRIVVGADEIHISGVHVIRMLNNVPWLPDEVEPFRSLVFHGADLDQTGRYYATLRMIFPNLSRFSFRKACAPPSVQQLNSLGHLESPTRAEWIGELSIESQSAGNAWQGYAIYRLHPFGLRQINGRLISRPEVDEAEDQYAILDSLVGQLSPPGRIQRQMDRFSQMEVSRSDGSLRPEADHQLCRKRAIRNGFLPVKEIKLLRNRSPQLKNLAEYGIECAVKLSILSQNWDKLLENMIHKAYREIQDESNYKRTRLAQLKEPLNCQTQRI